MLHYLIEAFFCCRLQQYAEFDFLAKHRISVLAVLSFSALITIFLMVLPLLAQQRLPIEDLSLSENLLVRDMSDAGNVSAVKVALVFCIGSVLPAVADLFVDHWTARTAVKAAAKNVRVNVSDRTERILISCSLLAFSSVVLIWIDFLNAVAKAYLLNIAMHGHLVIVIAVGLSKTTLERGINSTHVTIVFMLFCFSRIARMYRTGMTWANLPDAVYSVAYYLSFGYFMVFGFWLLIRKFKARFWRQSDDEINSDMNTVLNDALVTSYLAITLTYAISIQISLLVLDRTFTSTWSNISFKYCVSYLLIGSLVSALFARIPSRLLQVVYSAMDKIALAERHAFIRYCAHEIRSPLGSLQAGLEIIRRDLDKQVVSDEFKELLIDVEASHTSAVYVLSDTLDIESIEAGNFKLGLELSPWSSIVRSDVRLLKLFAHAHSVTIQFSSRYDAKPTLGEVKESESEEIAAPHYEEPRYPILEQSVLCTDNLKICNQVIRNLVTNAVKFTKDSSTGQVLITFIVSDKVPSAMLSSYRQSSVKTIVNEASIVGSFVIEVADNGVGMSPEDLQRLFGAFVQFNPKALQGGGGSGIGLWICKHMVTNHGGIIEVKSGGERKGTTFTVTLPLFAAPLKGVQHMQPQVDQSIATAQPLFLTADQSKGTVKIPIRTAGGLFDTIKSFFPIMSKFAHSPISPEAAAVTRDIESPAFDLSSSLGHRRPLKILIVDDSLMNRKMLHKLIESDPSSFPFPPAVTHASDGDIAVKMVMKGLQEITTTDDRGSYRNSSRTNSGRINSRRITANDGPPGLVPDLILMDYVMERMQGPEATKSIREAGYKGVILGVTGNVLPEDVNSFARSGVDAVLSKPLALSTLVELLRTKKLLPAFS